MSDSPAPGNAMLDHALRYLDDGLCVMPAIREGASKRVALGSWKEYQTRLPTRDEVHAWFGGTSPGAGGPRGNALCLVCGAVSGNLELLDFDLEGEAFGAWCDAVGEAPGGADLLARLVIETSPSGGLHVIYRVAGCAIPGNLKIAQRRIDCEPPERAPTITVGEKDFVPRRDGQGEHGYGVILTMIETRGEGGLFLCAPSPGYTITQGDLAGIPTITADERETLVACAYALSEHHAPPVNEPRHAQHAAAPSVLATPQSPGLTPGSDYNTRGDVRGALLRAGWTRAKGDAHSSGGGGEHWTRPGKTKGTSATLRVMDGTPVFYCFTSNGAPFEPGTGYAPFAVYALLEHAGDYSAAASELRGLGYGGADPRSLSRPLAGGLGAPGAPGAPDLSGLMASLGVRQGAQDASASPAGDEHRPAGPDASETAPGIPPTARYVVDLVASHPRLRPPIIKGLLREGESMNVIAAPKTGKSWLTLDLAIAVATGSHWLDRYPTVSGEVLILDNELHSETSAHRLPHVARARNVSMHEIGRRIAIDNMRGRLQSIIDLAPYFRAIEPGRFKVVILDAFYRFMPQNSDENDNGTMATVYNYIDAYASMLGCCFVLIHHTTKGNQSAKSVTDVGAGAGAQSRAVDTHLVLRPHEEEGVVVLDASVRSWAPIEPSCLRWSYPVWDYAPDLDPQSLRGESPGGRGGRGRRSGGGESGGGGGSSGPREPAEPWTVERFVEEFFGEPMTIADIQRARAKAPGLTWRMAETLVKEAEETGLLTRHVGGRGSRITYTKPPENWRDQ